jgi:ParB-like chromosome segregation protein Spo0J
MEFGRINPILVDGDNGTTAGHGQLLAVRQFGLTQMPLIGRGIRNSNKARDLTPRRSVGFRCN